MASSAVQIAAPCLGLEVRRRFASAERTFDTMDDSSMRLWKRKGGLRHRRRAASARRSGRGYSLNMNLRLTSISPTFITPTQDTIPAATPPRSSTISLDRPDSPERTASRPTPQTSADARRMTLNGAGSTYLQQRLLAQVPAQAATAPAADPSVQTVSRFLEGSDQVRSSAVATTRGRPEALTEMPRYGATAAEEYTLSNERGEAVKIGFDTERATGAGHYGGFDLDSSDSLNKVDRFSFSVNGKTYDEDAPNARAWPDSWRRRC